MDLYELLKGLISLLIGVIMLLLMKDERKTNSWDISYGMAKYGAIVLIIIGASYILYLIFTI